MKVMLVKTVATSRPSWIVFFYIGPRDAVHKIMKSRLLSAQKKVDDVAFYLDKKETERQPLMVMITALRLKQKCKKKMEIGKWKMKKNKELKMNIDRMIRKKRTWKLMM